MIGLWFCRRRWLFAGEANIWFVCASQGLITVENYEGRETNRKAARAKRVPRPKSGPPFGQRAAAAVGLSQQQAHLRAIIDDEAGRTLVSASTLEKLLGGAGQNAGNKEAATRVGKVLAERAVQRGLKQVIFDRGGYKFHGRVAALASAARAGGLEF